MSWKPVLVGGRKYDEMTWVEQIDAQAMLGEEADLELIGSLIVTRWPVLRLALQQMLSQSCEKEA